MLKRVGLLIALALGLIAPALAQTETSLNNFGSAPIFFLTNPSNGQCLVYQSSTQKWINATCSGGGGTGTVTSVSVVSANGLAGTVATSTTTPAITLSTSISGPLKGATGAVAAAAAADISGLYGGASGTGTLCLTVSCVMSTPALGTPSALVLTNATGLPAAALPAFSGDCTTTAGASALTCTKTSGVAFGTFATANAATPPAIGGTTPAAGNFTTLGATGAVTGANLTLALGGVTPTNGIAATSGGSQNFYAGGVSHFSIGSTGFIGIINAIAAAGAAPTVTGCSVSAHSGGVIAGQYTSGTTGTCTVTIAITGTTTAYICTARDVTTPADAQVQTGAIANNSVSFTGTTVSGDVIQWGCPISY